MPKSRVLLVTKLYHPWIGGVERHVQDLAESLKDRFDIKVLCCDEKPSFFRHCEGPKGPWQSQKDLHHQLINGIPVYKAPSFGIYFSMPVSPSFPLWFKRLAAESDIIHHHLPFPLGMLSHWMVRPTAKTIVTWHSDIVRQKFLARLLSPWTRWFLNRADAIITTTQKLLNSSNSLGPFKNKCRIIPLSINPKTFELTAKRKQAVQAIREKYGPEPIALFVGRLVPYKGPQYLLKALAQTRQKIKLLMAGDGPLMTEMTGLARHLGLNGRLKFLGSVEGEELIRLFHACDYFILPSVTNNEAFGIVQMEAMACGKPVINTDLPTGVPEVSLHEQTGLTVPPKDSGALAQAMDRLAQNTPLREKLGLKAKERAEKEFSLEKMASRLSGVYSELSS